MRRFTGSLSHKWLVAAGLLLAILISRYVILSSNRMHEADKRRVERRLERQIANCHDQVQSTIAYVRANQDVSFDDMPLEWPYPLFVYADGRLIFWNNYRYALQRRDIPGSAGVEYFSNDEGSFVLVSDTTGQHGISYLIVTLIPLVTHTAITNEYLKPDYNHHLFSGGDVTCSPLAETDYTSINYRGSPLFWVRFGPGYPPAGPLSSLIMQGAFLVFLLFFGWALTGVAANALRSRHYWSGLFLLVFLLLVFRGTMLALQFPFTVAEMHLFDPMNYASSWINPSLGDLLLNLLCLAGIGLYVFNMYHRPEVYRRLMQLPGRQKTVISVLLAMASFAWLGTHYNIFATLSYHSQWSMDITDDIGIDIQKLASYGIYFLSGVTYFLFAHTTFKWLMHLGAGRTYRVVFVYLAGTALYVLCALVFDWDILFMVTVNTLFLLCLVYFDLPRHVSRLQFMTFVYFFVFGVPIALTAAYANRQYSLQNINYNKEKISSQLLVENDLFAEFILREAVQKIKNDVYIQNRIYSPYASKNSIEQRIRRTYLSNYLHQYDIQIFVFNSRGQPFEPTATEQNYFDLQQRVRGFETDVGGLYLINRQDQSTAKRYLCFIEIRRYNRIAGYVLLNLKLKRFVSNTLYPRLLLDNRYPQQPDVEKEMSYAIFESDRVVNSYGSFNYRKNFPISRFLDQQLYDRGIMKNGYHHKAFRSGSDQLVVVSSRTYTLSQVLANFSFYFLMMVFSILIVLLFVALYTSIQNVRQNYATKIQLYLNIAFFAPLIIIGIAVLSVTVRIYKRDLETSYLEKAESLGGKISSTLGDYDAQIIDRERLSNEIYEIARYAELDINLFNTGGRLLATSQPLIYDNRLLSGYINPEAYLRIVEYRDNNCVLNETIGDLRYKNTYVAVQSFEDGSLIGILSLPFFASKAESTDHIIRVLITFLNILTGIFLLFLIISYHASRGLTFPLSLITQKIRKTTLSGLNEPLSWTADDEIGLMVEEYNKMLVNLEESKKALAATEKESAWREMAQQVAHEIKNPLTPMKLNLQHMRRRIDVGEEEDIAKRRNQIDLLLEQVNTLSEIANSFSAFAKMPPPENSPFLLNSVLTEVVALHNKQENCNIEMHSEAKDVVVNGDRKWISRALSNIIINGIQASGEQGHPSIVIRLYRLGQKARIEIEDNGEGIPEGIRDKVFQLNFSTKFTGSGIGLAMAKRGVEFAGGRIWFESTVGVGTVFYIELPID